MTIENRNMGAGEQTHTFVANVKLSGVTAGIKPLFQVPYPATIQAIKVANLGVSGTFKTDVKIGRFVVGAGATHIPCGNTLTMANWTVSGVQAVTLSATLLQAGDAIELNYAAQANTATDNTTVTIVVKALQDIRTHFGS